MQQANSLEARRLTQRVARYSLLLKLLSKNSGVTDHGATISEGVVGESWLVGGIEVAFTGATMGNSKFLCNSRHQEIIYAATR